MLQDHGMVLVRSNADFEEYECERCGRWAVVNISTGVIQVMFSGDKNRLHLCTADSYIDEKDPRLKPWGDFVSTIPV